MNNLASLTPFNPGAAGSPAGFAASTEAPEVLADGSLLSLGMAALAALGAGNLMRASLLIDGHAAAVLGAGLPRAKENACKRE
jgi:hypothetical protein